MNDASLPTIALLPWGDVIEDFLDSIGISFDAFCNEMTGGWLFGYVEALKRAGVRTVLFCISHQVSAPTRYTHKPTGATICVLPASKLHQAIHQRMLNPYGWKIEEVFGEVRGIRRQFYKVLRDISPYLATPLRSLAGELQRENCQAIVCQEYEYARFDLCALLGRLLQIPVFATFQGGDFQLSRLERLFRPLALRSSAGLIVAAQTEIERLHSRYGLPSTKIAKIFNPLDVENWGAIDRTQARLALKIPLQAQVVICHGRIELYRKGLDILMTAWVQLCRELSDRDLRLLLIGTGSDAAKLHQLIAEQQVPNVLWIDEYVRDRAVIQRHLSAADVYTLPSRHEGFPVAPIEAMACRLPVVAADAPGVSDILAGNAGGVIVPRENSSALAGALKQVLTNTTLCQHLGEQALQRARSGFSLEVIGTQLRDFLLSPPMPPVR